MQRNMFLLQVKHIKLINIYENRDQYVIYLYKSPNNPYN